MYSLWSGNDWPIVSECWRAAGALWANQRLVEGRDLLTVLLVTGGVDGPVSNRCVFQTGPGSNRCVFQTVVLVTGVYSRPVVFCVRPKRELKILPAFDPCLI